MGDNTGSFHKRHNQVNPTVELAKVVRNGKLDTAIMQAHALNKTSIYNTHNDPRVLVQTFQRDPCLHRIGSKSNNSYGSMPGYNDEKDLVPFISVINGMPIEFAPGDDEVTKMLKIQKEEDNWTFVGFAGADGPYDANKNAGDFLLQGGLTTVANTGPHLIRMNDLVEWYFPDVKELAIIGSNRSIDKLEGRRPIPLRPVDEKNYETSKATLYKCIAKELYDKKSKYKNSHQLSQAKFSHEYFETMKGDFLLMLKAMVDVGAVNINHRFLKTTVENNAGATSVLDIGEQFARLGALLNMDEFDSDIIFKDADETNKLAMDTKKFKLLERVVQLICFPYSYDIKSNVMRRNGIDTTDFITSPNFINEKNNEEIKKDEWKKVLDKIRRRSVSYNIILYAEYIKQKSSKIVGIAKRTAKPGDDFDMIVGGPYAG